MLGKGALIAAMGFTMVFSIYKINLTRAVFSTDGDFNIQYMQMLVHQAAVSGANLGIHKAWNDDWLSGNFSFVENGCSTTVTAQLYGTDTLVIRSESAGSLMDEDHYARTGQVLQIRDSVLATFAFSEPVSRYFWFSNDEGGFDYWNYWQTGDTVAGPLYTHSILRTSGSPIFLGKATSYMGIYPDPSSSGSQTNYYGGWEVGIDIPVPTNTTALVDAAITGNNGAPINTVSIYNEKTTFTFQADGSVIRQVGSGAQVTLPLSTIAPTGVIYSTADINVKGTLNGQLSIYSTDDIFIIDDLIYADDPTVNINSDDLLGLIAGDDIIVADNSANSNSVNIQACLLAIGSSFTAENWWERTPSGELRVYGSIVQNNRGRIGIYLWWWDYLLKGFKKKYAFDARLNTITPPSFPTVSHMRLIAWWE